VSWLGCLGLALARVCCRICCRLCGSRHARREVEERIAGLPVVLGRAQRGMTQPPNDQGWLGIPSFSAMAGHSPKT
jgi:hypothetical protein